MIKQYSISYMQKRKRMVQIVKFIYVMIIFLSSFVVEINSHGKPFFILFKFSCLLSYIILSHFNKIFSFSFFITTDYIECTTDYDCREEWVCPGNMVAKCFVSFALARFLSKGKCLCVWVMSLIDSITKYQELSFIYCIGVEVEFLYYWNRNLLTIINK